MRKRDVFSLSPSTRVRLCVWQVVLASSFVAVAPVRVAWRMVPWREGGADGLFDLAVRPVFRWLHDSNGHAELGYGLG